MISIITATYNSASTVRDTFESVLAQDYKDIEYIVVDGASTDGTVDIIKEYEKKFNGRMKWKSEPDKGIYDAMNKGIARATGDVVGFLNSDDFFSKPDVLSTIAKNIKGVDAVYADIHYVSLKDIEKTVRYYSSAYFRSWIMKAGFMPAHPTFYCRRELFEKYGNFDTQFKIAADFELLLRFIYIHKIKTKYIPADFVTMRVGGASTNGLISHKKILKDHMKAYKKNNVSSNYLFESFRYFVRILEILHFYTIKGRFKKK